MTGIIVHGRSGMVEGRGPRVRLVKPIENVEDSIEVLLSTVTFDDVVLVIVDGLDDANVSPDEPVPSRKWH